MSQYIDILNKGKKELNDAGIADFDVDGWILFEHIFKMSRTKYFLEQMKENNAKCAEEEYYNAIKKRCERIPIQHITGHQEFMGFDFFVNENTLVPRQDTEILVEEAINEIKKRRQDTESEINVLDMCTGSGCIGISVAKILPYVSVTASDLSEKALEVAMKNAKENEVTNIKFVCGNLFEGLDMDRKFDFIISNPPYIRTKDIEELSEEVRLHDPMIALDGMEDGLFFYERITDEAVKRLNTGGYLMYEIGFDQAEDVTRIMKKAGFDEIKVIQDLAGLDRVVTGKLH